MKRTKTKRGWELRALQAGARWLALRPTEMGESLSRRIAQECKVSRRALDRAVHALARGLAHPSREFLQAVSVSEQTLGRPLTEAELQSLVRNLAQSEEVNP